MLAQGQFACMVQITMQTSTQPGRPAGTLTRRPWARSQTAPPCCGARRIAGAGRGARRAPPRPRARTPASRKCPGTSDTGGPLPGRAPPRLADHAAASWRRQRRAPVLQAHAHCRAPQCRPASRRRRGRRRRTPRMPGQAARRAARPRAPQPLRCSPRQTHAGRSAPAPGRSRAPGAGDPNCEVVRGVGPVGQRQALHQPEAGRQRAGERERAGVAAGRLADDAHARAPAAPRSPCRWQARIGRATARLTWRALSCENTQHEMRAV